jgi:hypothetical protein
MYLPTLESKDPDASISSVEMRPEDGGSSFHSHVAKYLLHHKMPQKLKSHKLQNSP